MNHLASPSPAPVYRGGPMCNLDRSLDLVNFDRNLVYVDVYIFKMIHLNQLTLWILKALMGH